MNVEFTKAGEVYRGEFTVTSDFNIHIEKEMAGDCYLYVKGVADGEYASAVLPVAYLRNQVCDFDLSALVYPKHVRIDCPMPVKSCVVTLK